jgi:hypothetical protein
VTRVSPLPPLRTFGPVAAVLILAILVDLLVSQSASAIVLVVAAIALIATGPGRPADEVPDARARRALLTAQLGAVLLAFVAGALVGEDAYVAVAAATFLVASLAGRVAVAAWVNRAA